MKKRKEGLESLDSAIQIAQMDKFIEDFDKNIKKSSKKEFKKAVQLAAPIIILLVAFFATENPLFIAIGGGIMCTIATVTLVRETINSFRILNCSKEDIIREDELEETLERGVLKTPHTDFYTEEYVRDLEANDSKSPDEKKYEEALEKQMNKRRTLETDEFLDCQKTKVRILEELEIYNSFYSLPPISISTYEWNTFFEELYALFATANLEINFYRVMSELLRYTLSKALVNASKSITIENFLDNLYYINGGYGNMGIDTSLITEKDLKNLAKKLRAQIQSSKGIFKNKSQNF